MASLMLGTLHSMAFKVIRAIPVTITKREEGFCAEWEEIAEWGFGDSPSAARDDLIASIRESYVIYESGPLGKALQKDFDLMRQHIVKVA